MTGMVAIIARDRRCAVDEAEIEALARAYTSVRGPGREFAAQAGSFGRLVKIDSAIADRPGIQIEAGGWAAQTGTVYGPESLVGVDFGQLDGQFALIAYDNRTDRLVVVTDPFGLQPLYSAERDDRTYISSSALALARHLGAAPNELGLAVLLSCGSQYGSITNWKGIERIAPATVVTFGTTGRDQYTYWRPEVDDAVSRLTYQGSVNRAIEVVESVFQRHLAGRPRIWVDLTGGFDTRLLTLLLARAGVDFQANTVGPANSKDVRLGRLVARVAGWDWQRFDVPGNWAELAPSYFSRAFAWADGRLPALHLAAVMYIHERQGEVYHGHVAAGGGEAFGGHGWDQEFFRAGRTNLVNYDNLLRMKMMKDDASRLLAGGWAGEVYNYLLHQAQLNARPFNSALNTTQLDVLHATRRASWDGAFASASGVCVRSELPFMFKAVYSTAASINFRYRSRRGLMRAMIERLDPLVAAIHTTSGGTTQTWRLTRPLSVAPYYGHAARKTVMKVSRKIWGHALFAPGSVEHHAGPASRRAMLRTQALTPATMRSASLYKPGVVEAILRRAEAPNFKETSLLDRILTVELAMRAADAP
jgi:asparagine synthetase B (glutamine-hydrolysing)